MRLYQLSPHVFVETFADDAVLLIADRDVMVRVNHAAAQLYEQARGALGDESFSRADCVALLLETFDLSRPDAERQVRSLLGFALRQALARKLSAAA